MIRFVHVAIDLLQDGGLCRDLHSAKVEVSGTEPVRSMVRTARAMSENPSVRQKYSSRTVKGGECQSQLDAMLVARLTCGFADFRRQHCGDDVG